MECKKDRGCGSGRVCIWNHHSGGGGENSCRDVKDNV